MVLFLVFAFVCWNLLSVFPNLEVNPHWFSLAVQYSGFNTVNEVSDKRTKHEYQPRFLLEQILCWSKRQLETGLQSWCMECMSEWDSSLFSFGDGNRAAEVNIHLKQTSNENDERMVYVMQNWSKTLMQHTKNCSGWNRLLVNPERHLRKNDCHNARSIYLYHEVAHLPLQVEINCHDYIFTC